MFLSICLPVRHSIRLSIRLSAFLSVSLPISLSACPYVCLSHRLSYVSLFTPSLRLFVWPPRQHRPQYIVGVTLKWSRYYSKLIPVGWHNRWNFDRSHIALSITGTNVAGNVVNTGIFAESARLYFYVTCVLHGTLSVWRVLERC